MRIIIELLRLLQFVVFIRIILTWIMPGKLPPAIRPVTDRIDLVLRRFQVLIPMGNAYIDLGPMLFLALIEVIMRVLVSLMYSGAMGGMVVY
ncbi:MAG: YggT family protein [Candidatus Riflebacteria bacterium]|nr:YggT family protein [Candidatus Riflebacteria bacterium]